MQLVIDANGHVRSVYGEAINLNQLGPTSIRRGSHVEPTDDATWTADLSPGNRTLPGPFKTRSEALATEVERLHPPHQADLYRRDHRVPRRSHCRLLRRTSRHRPNSRTVRPNLDPHASRQLPQTEPNRRSHLRAELRKRELGRDVHHRSRRPRNKHGSKNTKPTSSPKTAAP